MSNRQNYHSNRTRQKADGADLWLQKTIGNNRRIAMAGDAGHRQYFRVMDDRGDSFVLMVDHPAGVDTFIKLRAVFAAAMTVPKVIAMDGGFCLLEDFGDQWYLRARKQNNIPALYNAALRALATMQTIKPPRFVGNYDDALLRKEMLLFDSWYCRRYLQQTLTPQVRKMLAGVRSFLCAEVLKQGRVLVHRDYHSRNLMVIGGRSPGVLDFQDAVVGSPFYDIVSLLRDAYTYWNINEQKKMLRYYLRCAKNNGIDLPDSFDECWRMVNIVGAQRGLKVLGIFARLTLRDGKDGFIKPMPLAYRHLLYACDEVPELAGLGNYLRELQR